MKPAFDIQLFYSCAFSHSIQVAVEDILKEKYRKDLYFYMEY